MYSGRGNAALPALGFPIRESADQWMFSSSPRLIAAVHALHRLLVPRHPPCALTILTVIRPDASALSVAAGTGDTRFQIGQHAVFKVRGGAPPPVTPAVGLSKLNSVRHARPRSRENAGHA